jgi:hypothetical protein
VNMLPPNSTQSRVCRCCQEKKGLEFFYSRGIYTATVCLACAATLPEVPDSHKRCSRCLEVKELGAFNFVKWNYRDRVRSYVLSSRWSLCCL